MTQQDQYHEAALRAVDLIQRFVYSGSFLPSVTAITQAVCRATGLKVVHLDDIGRHDATTLRHRRRNVRSCLPEVSARGNVQSLLIKPRRRRAVIASLAP
jgi:cyclopropane-fatty-acyl-phospholipid synthase